MQQIKLLIIALSFTGLIQAQDTTSFSFTFNHVSLCVKDVNKSVEFYIRVLKLEEITNRTKVEGIRWLSLNEGKELHLISTIKESFTTNKAIHLGLASSNFDSFIERLQSMKIEYSDWPGKPGKVNKRADGIKQIYFQDPDGYWIEVNSVRMK